MWPVHPLHRKAERPFLSAACYLNRLQMPEQRRPVIPMHMRARGDYIVALERRERDRRYQLEAERLGEAGKLLGDRLEARLVEIDEIHLVDGERDPADAEQRQDAGMTPRLRQYPAPRIDQQHGEIAIRRAGRHVARVLHMARRIGDDKFAPWRREIAIGDVDGNLLLALGLQAVDEESEVELASPAPAGTARIVLGAAHLVLIDQRGIVKQPADQCALAVIDAAAGEEAQQAAILFRRDAGIHPLAGVALLAAADDAQAGHQK